MRDFLPADVRRREYVIGIIKEVYERYGFEPLETPAVENIETLMGKYGEEGNQLIFKILKRGVHEGTGEADLALRYDLTVPLARVVAEYQNEFPRFLKRYQIQPVWRADRPGRGRFREFYQCDVDVVGSRSMVVEAELMAAASEALEMLGFSDFTIRLNHRQVLTGLLSSAGLTLDEHDSALVSFDKLDKIGREGVETELQQRGIQKSVADNLLNFFSVLHSLEQAAEITAGEDLEKKREGLNAGILGGGGRYDNLIGMFCNRLVPACGFSLGLERILVVMNERAMFPPHVASEFVDVIITMPGEEFAAQGLSIAKVLRAKNPALRVLVYPQPADKLHKQRAYKRARNIYLEVVIDEKGNPWIEGEQVTVNEVSERVSQMLPNANWTRQVDDRQQGRSASITEEWLRKNKNSS